MRDWRAIREQHGGGRAKRLARMCLDLSTLEPCSWLLSRRKKFQELSELHEVVRAKVPVSNLLISGSMMKKSKKEWGAGAGFAAGVISSAAGWTATTPAPAVEWLSAVNKSTLFYDDKSLMKKTILFSSLLEKQIRNAAMLLEPEMSLTKNFGFSFG